MATDKINKFVQGLNPAKSVLSTDLYGVEAGGSVRLNANMIREGLATSEDLAKAEKDIKAVADDLNTHIDEQKERDIKQDKALTDFKQEYTTKQTEQDEALISAVEALEGKDSAQDAEIADIQTKLLESAMKYRGEASIAEILENNIVYGDTYKLTDSGKLGNLDVEEGDTVVWNGTEWEKIGGGGSEPVIVEQKKYGLQYAYVFEPGEVHSVDFTDAPVYDMYIMYSRTSSDIDVYMPRKEAWAKWGDKEMKGEMCEFNIVSMHGKIILHDVHENEHLAGGNFYLYYRGANYHTIEIPENTICTIRMTRPWHIQQINVFAYLTMSKMQEKLVKGVQSVEVTEQSILLGHCAKDEDNLALALGNGTSDNHNNAMAVDWNGNMKTSGNITDGEGNILSKKVTLSDLAVNGRVTILDNNGELTTLTTDELRNLLMWVGTEAELDALPDSEIVEGRIYSTYDGTIKRR